MIELMKYFRVLFLTSKLSRERLKDFTEDHIQRLTANNPGGIFTAILAAITSAYNSYFGDLSSESLNLAVQQGKTIALNESRTTLEKLLSDNEKLVAYTYKANAATYEEFYPLGITEYLRADLPTLETISNRYKTVLGNHAADFTPAFVTEYNTVQGTFVTNRAAQQAAMGNVAAERSDIATTRPALALQLTKNLLTISLQYVGDETKADVYFNQTILNAAFAEADRRVEGEVESSETENVFDNISKAELGLMIKNTGTVPLHFGFAETPTTAIPNVPEQALAPGEEFGKTAGESGWTPANKYLNVTNYDGTIGSYVVQKV